MKDETNINKLWREAIRVHAACVMHLNGTMRMARLFRRDAYRWTVLVIEMQEVDFQRFKDLAESEGKPLDEWLDAHYEIIEQMGEHRKDLRAAIKAGMTEKQYVAQGPAWMAKRRSKAQSQPARVVSRQETETMSDKERLAYVMAENKSLVAVNNAILRDFAIVSRENDRLIKDMAKIQRVVLCGKPQKLTPMKHPELVPA